MIKEWSPVHLRNLLEKYYFANGVESVSALKVWQDACQYLYMPRLVNDLVLRRTIEEAIQSQDFFAFASGLRDDRFEEGFAFGKSSTVFLDEHSLLISQDAAQCYRAKLEQEARDKRDEESVSGLFRVKTAAMGLVSANQMTARTRVLAQVLAQIQ